MGKLSMTNQISESMDNLIKIQHILGELGFTLTSVNNYHKSYAAVDGSTYTVTPIFDNGISIDRSWELVAFDISSHKRVPIRIELGSGDMPLQDFPKECLPDISSILVQLAPSIAFAKKTHTFIITAVCGKCSTTTESFLHVSGNTRCLDCIED